LIYLQEADTKNNLKYYLIMIIFKND